MSDYEEVLKREIEYFVSKWAPVIESERLGEFGEDVTSLIHVFFDTMVDIVKHKTGGGETNA